MNRLTSILILCAAVQGCSSIDQPVASRALVDYQMVSELRPVKTNFNDVLNRTSNSETVILNGQQALLGESFFSAAGKTCRKVSFIEQGERVYCQAESNQWFEIESILADYKSTMTDGGH